MPRTSLPEIEKRLEMLAMLPQSLGETATMGDFYALDVEWLHAQNQRLREALALLAEHAGDAWSRQQARRALGQEQEAKP